MESSGAAGGGSHAPTLPPSPGAKWTPERRRGGSVAPIKRSVLLPFHPSRPPTNKFAMGRASRCAASSGLAERCWRLVTMVYVLGRIVGGRPRKRAAGCDRRVRERRECRWGWAHTQPARAPTRRRLPLTSREWPLLPRSPARMRCRARSKCESAQTVSVGMSTCTCHNHAGVRRDLRPPHACVSVTGARRPSPHVTLPWREMDRCRGV